MDNGIRYRDYCIRLKKYRTFIKGMKNKYIEVPNSDSNYIVQGFCFVNSYTLITAYDKNRIDNSIIYLINSNEELIKKVFLDGKYHCGGIAYHKSSDSIYITGDSNMNKGLSSYVNKYRFIDILNCDKVYACCKYEVDNNNMLKSSISNKSSVAYLTIYDNYIYLGNFSRNSNGKIKKYKLDNNGDILIDSCIILNNIHKNTQGMSLCKYNGEEYYIFSTSFGRVRDSIIYISKLSNNKFKIVKKIKFPVMSEQVNIDDGEVAFIFESSCDSFMDAKNRVLDICFFEFEKLL